MGEGLGPVRARARDAPVALRGRGCGGSLSVGPEPDCVNRRTSGRRWALRGGDTGLPSLYRRHSRYGLSAEGARRPDGRLGRGHGLGNRPRGLAAYLDGWRIAFAAPALAGVALAVLLARLPEPKAFSEHKREGPLVQAGRVLVQPWALVVVGIALVEGAVILGFLTFLAPSLESVGFSPAVAGLAVGLYGLAVLGWTRVVKLVSNLLGAAALILIGGGMLALGYATGAVGHSLIGVGVAAVLVGGGFAFIHTTLQTWATEVVPEARATVISLFAAALFAGSGGATAAAAPLADEGRFGFLFATAALLAMPMGFFAALARRRYVKHQA